MTGWGDVTAIEVQERLFYALAGNIALNNCFNARAVHAAVAAQTGSIRAPVPDYLSDASFGSLEVRPSPRNENIGQAISYDLGATTEVRAMTIDSLGLDRLDLLKIDVEGMELEVLEGASATLELCRPVIVVEHIKVGWDALALALKPLGYRFAHTPMNMIAVHGEDAIRDHVLNDGRVKTSSA